MTEMRKPAGLGSGGGQGRDSRAVGNPSQAHSTMGQVYAQGRVVGQVRGGIFHKTVRASIHMLRRPPAWALDVGSLLEAERLGAKSVQVHDTESGCTYAASVELIHRKGFTFDRGHGRQIALSLDLWTVTRPGQAQAEQLSLFGSTP